MYACMRTTLVLNDQLFRHAKREAASSGKTLSDLVNTALRKHLFSDRRGEVGQEQFSMPVFGEPVGLHQTPAQLATLRDDGR
jgi:hypothetical protein